MRLFLALCAAIIVVGYVLTSTLAGLYEYDRLPWPRWLYLAVWWMLTSIILASACLFGLTWDHLIRFATF